MGMGCPWCGPGMMGSGYATPQVNVNLSVSDVTSYLERWVRETPISRSPTLSRKTQTRSLRIS